MNQIDIFVLIIFAVFGLLGFYQGFLKSALNVASFFFSWLIALAIIGPLSNIFFVEEGGLKDTLLFYVEGGEYVHSTELARLSIPDITNQQLNEAMDKLTVPFPLPGLIEQNIVSEALVTDTSSMLGDTIGKTIVNFCTNVVCFAVGFLIVRSILGFLIKGYDYVFGLPVLRQFDSVLGAGLGLVNAFFILFVLFMFVPLIFLLLSQQGENATFYVLASELINDSVFGNFFYRSNFILSMMKGT